MYTERETAVEFFTRLPEQAVHLVRTRPTAVLTVLKR